MSDRLLTRNDIAVMLGMSPDMAASALREYGLHPMDFGRGRGRGLRWLESAVVATLRAANAAAQPKPKAPPKPRAPNDMPIHVCDMTTNQLMEYLTTGQPAQ